MFTCQNFFGKGHQFFRNCTRFCPFSTPKPFLNISPEQVKKKLARAKRAQWQQANGETWEVRHGMTCQHGWPMESAVSCWDGHVILLSFKEKTTHVEKKRWFRWFWKDVFWNPMYICIYGCIYNPYVYIHRKTILELGWNVRLCIDPGFPILGVLTSLDPSWYMYSIDLRTKHVKNSLFSINNSET